MKKNTFWDSFYKKPIDQIPWQNVQSDWFKKLVDDNEIKGYSAIYLGCGTGQKSIYLAKNGFKKVIGVDIAERAIELARQNATQENIADVCTFFCGDVTDWSFVKDDQTFDFILDWANLHGISIDQRQEYVDGINRHSHEGTSLLVRTFSTDLDIKHFTKEIEGEKNVLYVFNKDQIKGLFPKFKIVKKNISQSEKPPRPGIFFLELLMVC